MSFNLIQEDNLNLNVTASGDFDLELFLSPSSTSAVESNMNPEILTPNVEIIEISNTTQSETNVQPQSSRRRKDNNGKAYEKKKKIRKLNKQTENKKKTNVKRECIDEVETEENMIEIEKLLYVSHYDMLCNEFMKVIHEKCNGCQTDEPNQLARHLCLFASSQEQVDECFDETYLRVKWNDVLDIWNKKISNIPVVVNPERLLIFKETVNHNNEQYKNRWW